MQTCFRISFNYPKTWISIAWSSIDHNIFGINVPSAFYSFRPYCPSFLARGWVGLGMFFSGTTRHSFSFPPVSILGPAGTFQLLAFSLPTYLCSNSSSPIKCCGAWNLFWSVTNLLWSAFVIPYVNFEVGNLFFSSRLVHVTPISWVRMSFFPVSMALRGVGLSSSAIVLSTCQAPELP